jgi:hypothetical protein
MKHLLITLLIFLTFPCYSQDTSTIEFAQVYYKKQWRIIDRQGNFILNQGYGVGSNLLFHLRTISLVSQTFQINRLSRINLTLFSVLF